jgi:outer membrane lipase/esterase
MTSRRQWHLSALSAVVGAALLAACGGGDPAPTTSRVIAFGDSLTDIGTYLPATQIPLGQAVGVAPFLGGKFTTNTHTGYTAASNTSTANIWVEWIAARLGVAMTPAEVGFITTRLPCPTATTLGPNSCTGYAQGGARVTDPNGIGKSSGFLTIPIAAQIASHNTRTVPGFTAGFGAGDIVFVWGGHNDAFTQLGAAAAGAVTPDAAVANMQTAGAELANLVKSEILGKGASRVAVLNAVDISVTPGYSGLPAANKALLTQLTAEFNTTLLAGLSGTSAKIIDVRSFLNSVIANPAIAGLTNATTTACDPAKIQAATGGLITNGTSLFCNGSAASAFLAPLPNLNTLKAGASAATFLFADDVHPTTGGHKATADFVWTAIKGFGWAPSNL